MMPYGGGKSYLDLAGGYGEKVRIHEVLIAYPEGARGAARGAARKRKAQQPLNLAELQADLAARPLAAPAASDRPSPAKFAPPSCH
jgi:hypothetical protein